MGLTTSKTPNFGGYASRYNRLCSDGRTIIDNAFKHQDKMQIPLVWHHHHDDPDKVLGHAIIEHREDGPYTYAFFNDTDQGQIARKLVEHGDIKALSIHARNLVQKGLKVHRGDIKEVSLVVSGANPDAYIDNINLQHSDDEDALIGEAIIYSGETFSLDHADYEGDQVADTETVADVYNTLTDKQKNVVSGLINDALKLNHSDEDESTDEVDETKQNEEGLEHADKTIGDVLASLTPIQKTVVDQLIGEALASKSASHSDDDSSEELKHNQEGSNMPRNLFESNGAVADNQKTLTHADIKTITETAVKNNASSWKQVVQDYSLNHADYGIENIELLFPDARTLANTPELIARQAEWVPKVLGATKHAPFAKIKSIVADLTAEEARAKGYIKGTEKKEEVVKLLQRSTSPTTVYKKQKLDRDDILDIVDLDVVAWLKWEIRFMLNEEIARAILIGDGRSAGNPDKIKDPEGAIDGIGIRSIANDSDLYAHKVDLTANVAGEALIDAVTRARTEYRGSGNPTFYTTDKILTDLFLVKDKMNRRMYGTEAELASAMRVKEFVAVEVLEETPNILGIMVNLSDYTVGSNKGGDIAYFEDFDIDFNQQKYLMETRISGALTKPKSAIIVRREQGTLATAAAPSFNGTTNTITIPTSTGVIYTVNGESVTGNVVITEDTTVVAVADEGYYLEPNSTKSWPFVYTSA